MAAVDRENLISELNRLLAAGEPLLTLFPQQPDDHSTLQLPNNISPEMYWYARDVTLRASNGNRCRERYLQHSAYHLRNLVQYFEAGLLGWRAVGALP